MGPRPVAGPGLGMRVTKQELLRRAAAAMGRARLAALSGIPETLLDAWIRGDATMADGKLLVLAAMLDRAAIAKK